MHNHCVATYPLVAEDPEGALEPFLVVPGDRDARKTQVLADLSEDPIKTEISNLDVVCMQVSGNPGESS